MEVVSLFGHYLSNKTFFHDKFHYCHFSRKKSNFSVAFIFILNNQEYKVIKKYKSDGSIEIECDFRDNLEIIREFFSYSFLYFKKSFLSHLSKGELAIKFLVRSFSEIDFELNERKKYVSFTSDNLIIAFDEPDNKIHPAIWVDILNKLLSYKVTSLLTSTNVYTLESYINTEKNVILTYRELLNDRYVSKIDTYIRNEASDYLDSSVY